MAGCTEDGTVNKYHLDKRMRLLKVIAQYPGKNKTFYYRKLKGKTETYARIITLMVEYKVLSSAEQNSREYFTLTNLGIKYFLSLELVIKNLQ